MLTDEDREALARALGREFHGPMYGECAACSSEAERVWDEAVRPLLLAALNAALNEAAERIESARPGPGRADEPGNWKRGERHGRRRAASIVRAAINPEETR